MQALPGQCHGEIHRDCRTLIAALITAVAAYAIDGDTFAVDSTRVRLWGIDAPELDTDAGRRAQGLMRELLRAQVWYCEAQGTDRYGRTVAICLNAQGADLACTMVAQGLARDWPRYSGGYYRSCQP